MATPVTLSAADLQMKHSLEGAPDPFPSITDTPVKSRKAAAEQPLDVSSEAAFPSLGGPTKATTSGWGSDAGPRIKAAAAHLMLVESFTLQVMDLSTAGKDGKPTTLGEIMRQVMAKHTKVKVEASSNQRSHQTTFNVKSESQNELEKAKRMLLALLSPVVTLIVDAPVSTIPSIIGTKGANLKLIREQTGVKVDIPRRDALAPAHPTNGATSGAVSPVPGDDDDDEEPTLPVSITGPKPSAYEAQELINRIVSQKRSKATQRVKDIPAHILPFVKARRAAFEGAAQGAAVSLTLNQSSREITVVGDRPAVIAVIEAIKSTVEEYGSTLQQLPTSLPKRQHRLLTGKNADEIMAETKCAIIVADPDDESNAITVWGKPEDLGAGITAALSKANSQYIHEFPLPGPAATSRQIATYMINIDYPQKLSQEHWGVHVYLPSAAAIAKAQSISLDILGEKATVDAAVRQVSELIGKLIGAVDEVKADWLLHRTLQGTKNSKKLKQLQEAHNVRIMFPSESSELSSILLVYDPDSPKASPNPVEKSKHLKEVKSELEKLVKEAGDVKTEIVTVEPKWQEAVVGRNGTTLNAIIGEENTLSIKIGKEAGQADRVDVVLVRGTASEVDRAVQEITKIVEDAKNDEIVSSYSTEFDIDREYVARIVGSGGSGINRIRDQLGVRIDFDEANDKDKEKVVGKKKTGKTHVKIVGRKENAEEAKKRILASVERMADETFETIKVPVQYHAALIGQGGKYAIRLEENYAVKITFPRHGENGEARTRETLKPDEVLIKGGKKGVAQAKAELLDALEFEKESNAELKFTIPRRAVARVLGRGGATVNDIKDQTGAQIDIDKDSGDNAVIIVHGSKQVIADAKAMILEIAEQVHEEKSDVVTVESKYHRTLIGAGGQGLRDLIARAGGPSDPKQQVGLVRFPPAAEGSDEIRLRGEPKLVAKLKAELEKAAAEFRDRVVIGVEIPASLHRALIGRGGQHLNDLQNRTGTQVQFPGSRSYHSVGEMANAADFVDIDPANIVKVSGPQSGCDQAIADLKAAASRETRAPRPQRTPRPSSGQEITATVSVPIKYHHVISNQGNFFRSLKAFGVHIDHSVVPPKLSMPKPPADGSAARIDDVDDSAGNVKWHIVPNYSDAPEGDSEWTLRARDQEGLDRAQKRLQEAMDQAEKMAYIGFLSGLDQSVFPRIIGTKGANISRLRDETGADINVSKDDDTITITGTQSAIDHAKEEILKIATRPARGGRRDD